MTDEEVIRLYRTLLGRDPDDTATIRGFQAAYEDLERGRRAIFVSEEFDRYFLRVTERPPHARDPLAMSLLTRAAKAAPPLPAPPTFDEALRAGMRVLLGKWAGRRPDPAFAVVIGQSNTLALEDLLPFSHAQAAILHVANGFPPVVPIVSTPADGTAVFRLAGDATSLADILRDFGRRVDALVLLGRPAAPDFINALRHVLAPPALVVVGPAREEFDAPALSDATAAAWPGEPVQRWRGLHIHHLGDWRLPVTYKPPRLVPPLPDRADYPLLAVAAIVRDEAVCIENMLRSVFPVASFLAVLDTGSTDATPELAQAVLAESGIPSAFAVRHHTTFGSDFSAMRNAALAMVPKSCAWVLMLDADEALAPEDAAPLLALIAGGSHDAYALPRYNFPGAGQRGRMMSYPDRQVRLLRHRPDRPILYTDAVHETVRGVSLGSPPLDESAVGGPRGGPHIHHLVRRFRTPEEEARKQAFYKEIESRQA